MPDAATPDSPHVPVIAPDYAPPAPEPSSKRLGLLGGTFDPPHIGHVVAAASVRVALDLDEVWLVVANEPWQKVGQRRITPAADRFAMAEAAALGINGVAASDLEIERGGTSYTADTIAALHREDPRRSLFVIVGADAAGGLLTWQRPEAVRSGATMVLVDRPGAPHGDRPHGWRFEHVEMPRLDVSSTDLRARVAAGRPIDGLVPVAVSSVIRERGLYRGPGV